jgi:hypothetical protein
LEGSGDGRPSLKPIAERQALPKQGRAVLAACHFSTIFGPISFRLHSAAALLLGRAEEDDLNAEYGTNRSFLC